MTAWSESILDRLFIVLPREGGAPCRCCCHPRLPDSDFHDYGFSYACRLTTEERRRHTDERRAHLAALWNSAAERARRQAEENDLASWLAGQHDFVISPPKTTDRGHRRRARRPRLPLASFITRALSAPPEDVAGDVAAWRTQFDQVYFTTDNPTVPPVSASW